MLWEILVVKRMEKWWTENEIVSNMQGACKKGSSCIHTETTLQQTIAHNLDKGKTVFGTFIDVSKAFDGDWIDGLFFRLHVTE